MYLPSNHLGFKFHSFYNPCLQIVELYMRQGDSAPEPIVMARCEENTPIEPLIKLQLVEAQGLFDALWSAGLRPSTKEPVTGIIEAKDEHIKDLRKVAFNDG